MQLVVVRAFATYPKGDRILDPQSVARVIGSADAMNVVRIAPSPPPATKQET